MWNKNSLDDLLMVSVSTFIVVKKPEMVRNVTISCLDMNQVVYFQYMPLGGN